MRALRQVLRKSLANAVVLQSIGPSPPPKGKCMNIKYKTAISKDA